MHRSEIERVPRRRRSAIRAIAALVAASALAGAAAPAGATAAEAETAAVKRCATLTGGTGTAWTNVTVVKRRGVKCPGARKVIARCLTNRKVKGWKAINDGGRPGLRRGKKRIRVKVTGKAAPRCLERRRAPQLGAASYRTAGPYEEPTDMPPTSSVGWTWTSPVVSNRADFIDVGAARLVGYARTTPGDVRSVWFEYGTTRDLGTKTEALPPQVLAGDRPWQFAANIKGLRGKTRYFWRAVASIGSDSSPKVVNGTIGSFVTEPYRNMGGDNPCSQKAFGGDSGGITQVTTALTIVCTPKMQFVNDKWIVASVGYNGRIQCPPEYPHNLNSGTTDITIPDINYTVHFNNIVNYWRSNNSARFTTFPGYQQHFAGAEAGPLVGWHNWDVDQWGYLFETSRTDVQMWINCTDNWQAYTPAQLAPPQGGDSPSGTRPATPTEFGINRVAGGWKASWKGVGASGLPDGIAGYELVVSSKTTDLDRTTVRVTSTDTETTLSDAYVKSMSDIYRTKQLYAVLFAISSEGNRSGQAAIVPFTAP